MSDVSECRLLGLDGGLALPPGSVETAALFYRDIAPTKQMKVIRVLGCAILKIRPQLGRDGVCLLWVTR